MTPDGDYSSRKNKSNGKQSAGEYAACTETRTADELVGPFVRQVEEAEFLYPNDVKYPVVSKIDGAYPVVFNNDNSRRMTRLMEYRLKKLSKIVEKTWTGCKLKITDCWLPGSVTPHGDGYRLHFEGRMADITLDPEDDGELPALCEMCKLPEVAFEFATQTSVNGKNIVHVAVPREDYLFLMYTEFISRHTFDMLKSELLVTWNNLLVTLPSAVNCSLLSSEFFSTNIRMFPLEFKANELTLIDIVLQTAAGRGLAPKPYFLKKEDRFKPVCQFPLVPVPASDLPTIMSPPSVTSLVISLRSYSAHNKDLVTDRMPVQSLANQLTGASSRYNGINIDVIGPMKSRLVTFKRGDLPAHVSLTRILDAVAFQTHGQWFWSDSDTISVLTRC